MQLITYIKSGYVNLNWKLTFNPTSAKSVYFFYFENSYRILMHV